MVLSCLWLERARPADNEAGFPTRTVSMCAGINDFPFVSGADIKAAIPTLKAAGVPYYLHSELALDKGTEAVGVLNFLFHAFLYRARHATYHGSRGFFVAILYAPVVMFYNV